MTMDQEARAVMQQLVDALAPLKQGAPTIEQQDAPDAAAVPRRITLGAMRRADAALAAAVAALAATAG